ncbi:hypothetical protein SNOG_05089 [Parastagonospora nodorum SN15]|uniref:Uncharacterized protein n=1 Tax=Phaeosphaeria nodorum (strain SN15 / ATCC MYA-4574 / FGSC 10173) TaxID=321614 RepID=Q0UT25_PHANO|nr:hypothetical protein SNOG_05089 [Parastagonospora nodorum SN15]EAT87480.1 hypothetical protein SNOG_05089 [Parastagonospora nodorum SN15]
MEGLSQKHPKYLRLSAAARSPNAPCPQHACILMHASRPQPQVAR